MASLTPLKGIVAAPVLPMLPDASIDWTSLRSYIGWIADQRPTAIAMNMDASEGPSLERDEQLDDPAPVQRGDRRALPLVSGLIAGSTQRRGALGRDAEGRGRAGARGLSAVPDVSRQSGARRR